MSGDERPPRGPWGDVLDEVREALDDAGVGAGELRDGLVRGVRDALDALQRPPTGGARLSRSEAGDGEVVAWARLHEMQNALFMFAAPSKGKGEAVAEKEVWSMF